MRHGPNSTQRFKLTATNVARHFKHRCDRLFRYEAVEARHRQKPGIGWNVPRRDASRMRPAVQLLMGAGDTFELDELEKLRAAAGEGALVAGEVETGPGGRQSVAAMPLVAFKSLFDSEPPRYAAQVEIALPEAEEARFLGRFGLSASEITVSAAKPDLIEIISHDSGYYLRIWDFKASPAARHEHFIQVAYYSLLLEHALAALGLHHVTVDASTGIIRSRKDEPEEFELAPYRLAVTEFLTRAMPDVLATAASDAHFHVSSRCLLCEYLDATGGCQEEADAGYDLSRIAYLSSESKRRLKAYGITTHRHLAVIDPEGEESARLRGLSHDLSINLTRYIAAAQALEDGLARPLAASTLHVPAWEDVRVVVSAEQDGVTGTCFALGIKTYEGFDAEKGRPVGIEEVFVSEAADGEEDLLRRFLARLNDILERVHAHNKGIAQVAIEDNPAVRGAAAAIAEAEEAAALFKENSPARLYKSKDEHLPLIAERAQIDSDIGAAKAAYKAALKDAQWQRKKAQKSLHFYFYDTLDLKALKTALERHLFTEDADLQREIVRLVRLFPPESVLPDASTFRTIPGSVVVEALRSLVALPVPYHYDLESVSALYQPHDAQGEERGYAYKPAYGFGWKHSNQVAFERIHDVWNGLAFETKTKVLSPEDVRRGIERTVRNKLLATDEVIRRLKEEDRRVKEETGVGMLLLRKEPFFLHEGFDPSAFDLTDALHVFTLVEAALSELQTKHLHTMPAADRAARFEAITGLRYAEGADEEGGALLWFTFDGACRDAKFSEGDWSLVVTPEDEPEILIHSVDGPLFAERAGSRYRNFRVTLAAYDLKSEPPRLALRPDNLGGFRQALDLSKRLVLDKLHEDFLTGRVTDTLGRLRAAPEAARHVAELLQTGSCTRWQPLCRDVHRVRHALRRRIGRATGKDGRPLNADSILNAGQWEAWQGVFFEPMTMIWGPPGTGKTHAVAHILLGYALAAQELRRPLRILVTAATHHAIANVLRKTAELAAAYGFTESELAITKVGKENAADAELPASVTRTAEDHLSAAVSADAPACLIAGSTVWSLYKTMKGARGPGIPMFDVVLVDEASQLRLPDALIALAASKPQSNVILAGDDQQLPPIVHGVYPEEHAPLLSSVFAFARHRMEERAATDPGVVRRTLFQLTENFRMSEPLTAYPREAIYGTYRSAFPDTKIASEPVPAYESGCPVDLAVHPDRAAVLISYAPPQSFTARNPVEALLAARIVERLSQTLIDPKTGKVYAPEAFAAEGVAVLSPHRAQNAAIRAALADVGFGTEGRPMPLVDTVEKLQGKERDVVVVSYGVADAEYAEAEAEFLLSRNRFNVAATRGRAKLIVLCSDVVLSVVPPDQRVMAEAMMLKEFRSYCADGESQVEIAHPGWSQIAMTVRWKGF